MQEIKVLLAVGILMMLCIGLIALAIYVDKGDKKQKAEERKRLKQELHSELSIETYNLVQKILKEDINHDSH